MKKKFGFFAVVVVVCASSLFSGCALDTESSTSSPWNFTNSASGVDYIVVTPTDSENDSPFTLYYGGSHSVTWKGKGDNYRGAYKWTTHYSNKYVSGSYAQQYDSLKEIVFYTNFK